MKKTLTALVTAACLTMAPTSVSLQTPPAATVEEKKERPKHNRKEKEDIHWQDKLDDINRSVFCVRNDTTYFGIQGIINQVGHGTGFAYKKNEDGRIYLFTNKHVVTDKNLKTFFNSIFFNDITIGIVEYKYSLVQGTFDHNLEDDISLELVRTKDAPIDTAVLLTKDIPENLHVSEAYIVDPNFEPKLGDQTYAFGCHFGNIKFMTSGKVGNVNDTADYPTEVPGYLLIDGTVNFGASGGPIFIRRGNDLYLAGQTGGYLGSSGSNIGYASKLKHLLPTWELEND